MRRRLHLTLSTAALVALLVATSAQRAAAYPGGRTTVNATTIWYQTWDIPAYVGLTIETLNLSAGSDTVLHVQSYPAGDFIAGNDDCCGSWRSKVTLTARSYARTVYVIVRAFSNGSAGTCTLRYTPSIGSPTDLAISFAGTSYPPGSLVPGSHVFTVEQQGGATDTAVLVTSGATAYAFDDDDGIGLMSWIHLNSACTACRVVVGRHPLRADGNTTLIWDQDIHYYNCDSDGLGDGLEDALGTGACTNDTDQDGLGDGAEVIGVASIPEVKLPYYGADALKKDVFVEQDWEVCQVDNPPGRTCGLPPGDPNIFRPAAADALPIGSFFAPNPALNPDVALHIDNGYANTNPTTRTKYGNWGGAQGQPYGSGCSGLTAARVGLFHHGLMVDAGAGDRPGHCYNADGRAGSYGMHAQELGHNFSLDHGGNDAAVKLNCKPHYKSPMNYGFLDDPLQTTFSRNEFGSAVLNPTALNEATGLGTTDWSRISYLAGGAWRFKVRASDGAVDWNRDGDWAPVGTTVRGAPTWAWASGGCEQSVQHPSAGMSSSDSPSMSWLNTPLAGQRFYYFSRRASDGRPEYRFTTNFSACVLTDLTDDCAAWYPALGNAPLLVPNAVAGTLAPAADWFPYSSAYHKLMLVYPDSTGYLRYQVLTVSSGGVGSWTDPSDVDASNPVTTDPVVIYRGGAVDVYATSGGTLRRWSYAPAGSGSWVTLAEPQLWTDLTAVSPSTGIAVTPGYQADLSGQRLYAAIPVAEGQIEMARRDPATGRWVKLAGSLWQDSGTLTTDARPGLAFVPFNKAQSLTVGRFFLAFRYDNDGTYVPAITMTEGNDPGGGATVRRLRFLPTVFAGNVWSTVMGGTPLEYDPTWDENPRLAFDSAIDNKVVFFPFADGVFNVGLRDQDDYNVITTCACCSLTTAANEACPKYPSCPSSSICR